MREVGSAFVPWLQGPSERGDLTHLCLRRVEGTALQALQGSVELRDASQIVVIYVDRILAVDNDGHQLKDMKKSESLFTIPRQHPTHPEVIFLLVSSNLA